MKFIQVTIRTAAFEEEIRFYEEIAGLTIVRDARPGRQMVFLADAPGDTNVEILETADAIDTASPYLSIGFQVADAEAMRADLLARGLEATEMIQPSTTAKFFYVKDPAGVQVQFLQRL